MLSCQRAAGLLVLVLALVQWQAGSGFQAQALQEQPMDSPFPLGPDPAFPSREDKSAAELAAKLLLLDELVSLENDVIETKKKRSFSGFGSPLDRLSATSVDLKAKQRKVVELPKRRFGIPLDRIGVNRLSNTRGLTALAEAAPKRAATTTGVPVRSTPSPVPSDPAVKRQAS